MPNKTKSKKLSSVPKLPSVFVGSAGKSLRAAEAISNNLRQVAFVKPWTKAFTLSQTTIEDLVKNAPTYDFAIFILAAEDVRRKDGAQSLVPRDNVIFETGLFMGVLGRERVFIVKRSDVKIELPTDLLGLTFADYNSPPTDDIQDWEVALNYATTRIRDVIKKLKFNSSSGAAVTSTEGYLKDAAQYFDKLLVDRYGVSTRLSSTSVTISDLDGSAIIRRKLQGIKVSGPIKIDQIPGRIAPFARDGRITKHPTLIKKVKFKKPVFVSQRVKKDTLSVFDVVIKGSLTQADPKLDFEYESSLTKAFLMTREEVEKTYEEQNFQYEYISLRTEMPTDKARLEISFPKGYAAELYPGVFFGDESESMHDSELNRVADGFTRRANGARFVVDKPVVGFNYIIYWISPSKDDLARKFKPVLDRRKIVK
jgi:predicted nucleotide-binding protein